jgi:endonuclease VIII
VPEGDTIHRTALALDRALAGGELTRFQVPRLRHRPFPPGTIVEGAEAAGKHCLIHFDDGRTLRSHMGMTGSWHLYRTGERWRRSPAGVRAIVAVPAWEAVCFAAPTVELTTEPAPTHLGPDLCREDADLEEALRRMASITDPERSVGEVLLDQCVVSGIGNIWKNESCFACGIDPSMPIGVLDREAQRRLLVAAASGLRRSVAGDRPTMAVYGRAGKACPRCGGPIQWRRQGTPPRGTYWCPACQPARSGTPAR